MADIEALVAELERRGHRSATDIVSGIGGEQILVEAPCNVVELFEPHR